MTNLINHLSTDFDSSAEKYIFPAIVFLATALFLVLKSGMTTAVFFLAIVSLVRVLVKREDIFRNRGRIFWLFAVALCVPFFSELAAQTIRQSLVMSSLDGPSRGLLAAVIFFYLSVLDKTRIFTALRWGSLFGILAVLLSLLLFPTQYWSTRAATYFVDPITLPCFTTMLLGIFLFSAGEGRVSKFEWLLRGIGIIATLYVGIESGSRSAWLASLVLTVVFIFYATWGSPKQLLLALLMLIAGLVITYQCFPNVEARFDRAIDAIANLIGPMVFGLADSTELKNVVARTSTGHRAVLLLVDIELLKLNPISGTPDGMLPAFDQLRDRIPLLTQQIYEIKLLAGSHAEFMAQLVKKGLVFGSASVWALFLYPFWVGITRLYGQRDESRQYAWMFLGGLLPILISAVTIQVFNLKMTICFYTLFCAIFFSLFDSRKQWCPQ